jgi:hypothetical protein
MREDPVEGLSPSHSTDARSAALHRPVSIGEGSRLLPPAVDTPVQAENRDDATSSQAAEFDVWEDEGGAPRVICLSFRAGTRNGISMNSRPNSGSWRMSLCPPRNTRKQRLPGPLRQGS